MKKKIRRIKRVDLKHLKWMLINHKGLSVAEADKHILAVMKAEKKDKKFNKEIKEEKSKKLLLPHNVRKDI